MPRAPAGLSAPSFPAGEGRWCGVRLPASVDTEWTWPWVWPHAGLTGDDGQGGDGCCCCQRSPLGTLCAKTCWVVCIWVCMSRLCNRERRVFTGF